MAMRFVKMHGIGNDYIYISGFDQPIPDDPSALAVRIADRHFGVGGDGLILVLPPEPGSEADAVMRMFNADGSEGGMCGNGIRCVAKFLYDGGYVRAPRIRVKTKGAGVLSLDLEIDPASDRVRRVRVEMGAPILRASAIPTTLPGDPPLDHPIAVTYDGKTITYRGTAVSMGNPHLVMFVEDVASIDLERIGPLLERHEAFPDRVNVHVAQVDAPDVARMRTWERGSGITLACGTGACAVLVAGVLTGRTARAARIHLPGGALDLEWPRDGETVVMTGPAVTVFEGVWDESRV